MQRKSENINTLIQSRLNTRKGEFNQYHDLLKLDTHYHSKLEGSEQIEGGNWFDKVDQNIYTFKGLKKVRGYQYRVSPEAQVPVLP